MIPKRTFYDRRDNHCLKCEFWRGACLKGHVLSSPQGCPLKKFEPILGADYAPDLPATIPEPPAGDCCGKDADLSPMSWTQAAAHLSASLAEWVRTGVPLTDDVVYDERVDSCQDGCPSYRWFQCRLCKCLIFTKAKLPHETCPAGRWKR
jgi:hypothetical protein